mgnify:CR=1 FL=1
MKPTIRGNGHVIYPKEAVLPKKRAKKEAYSGTIKVLEVFNNKAEVNQSDWQDELSHRKRTKSNCKEQ